jgi:hypothetical protein
VQVKSPFKAEEITSHYNPNEDVLIFVRSEKDETEQPKPGGTKKDGSPAYFQPWTGKNLQPFSKHAYIAYLPTVEFGPGITSATEIRNAWPTLNDKRKTAMVMSLYPVTQKNPKLAANVVKMLDMGMGNESIEEDISRRGFLRGLGAAAVAGAAGSAMAQSRPVDVSKEFQNMRQNDPRIQHNKDIEEMARAIYEQIVATRGQPIDRRQQQMWMTIAREKATEKLSKYAPGRPAQQSQSSGFPAQGSERRVSRNIDNFESQGVEEAKKKRKKKSSKSLRGYFFPGYAYYGGSESGEGVGGDGGGGESIDHNMTEGPFVQRIMHPKKVSIYLKLGKGSKLVATDIPYEILDSYVKKVIQKYPQFKPTDFSFKSSDKVTENLGIPYPSTYEQENNKFKRRGPMRITNMTEFAPPGSNDREPDEEEILRQLAAQWWNGTDQQMKKAQQTLQAMGWEIGQDESGDDDAGVFVIRIGDVNGDSYIAFPHSELGLNEDYLNEI